MDRDTERNGMGGIKLRTYRTFKQEYKTEAYIKSTLPRSHRSAHAKFRCRVAPFRIESGQYERIQLSQRKCFHCVDSIES